MFPSQTLERRLKSLEVILTASNALNVRSRPKRKLRKRRRRFRVSCRITHFLLLNPRRGQTQVLPPPHTSRNLNHTSLKARGDIGKAMTFRACRCTFRAPTAEVTHLHAVTGSPLRAHGVTAFDLRAATGLVRAVPAGGRGSTELRQTQRLWLPFAARSAARATS